MHKKTLTAGAVLATAVAFGTLSAPAFADEYSPSSFAMGSNNVVQAATQQSATVPMPAVAAMTPSSSTIQQLVVTDAASRPWHAADWADMYGLSPDDWSYGAWSYGAPDMSYYRAPAQTTIRQSVSQQAYSPASVQQIVSQQAPSSPDWSPQLGTPTSWDGSVWAGSCDATYVTTAGTLCG